MKRCLDDALPASQFARCCRVPVRAAVCTLLEMTRQLAISLVLAMWGCSAPSQVPDDPPDAGPTALGMCGDVAPATNHEPFAAIRRLATTHDEVRILVWGQSISAQDWWLEVRDWLRTTYPDGNLVMENHSRGACSSECLVGRYDWFTDGVTENRLPGDVYAWHPDLILFNVYGSDDDYAYVIKGFAQGCRAFDDHPASTAHCRPDQIVADHRKPEVLLQTDHRLPSNFPITPEEEFQRYHNEELIPMLASTYGFAVGDIWRGWGAYLEAHGDRPSEYLEDGLHLNERGNALMASLIKRDLCYRPAP